MASTRTTRRTVARITRASFTRLPGSLKPFKRAFRLMEKMVAIVDKGLLPIDRQIELNALPPYVSHGHGGRHRVRQRIVGSHQFQDRSKYSPNEPKRRHAPPAAGYSVPELVSFVDALAAKTKHDARAV
jgi:hypothetical protein